MANAVGIIRDMPVSSERSPFSSFTSWLAYLEDVPLPPLSFGGRRVGTQNLPPVRNLLTHPEDADQTEKADLDGAPQSNVANSKVPSIAQLVETSASNGKTVKSPGKPLKRGPKGPRKYTAPKPLGPLKPIAPKVATEDRDGPLPKVAPSQKSPLQGSAPKKTPKKQPSAEKPVNKTQPAPNSTADQQTRSMNVLSLNPPSSIELPATFGLPEFSMDSAIFGSASSSLGHSLSTQSTPYHELPQNHFPSLHGSPHILPDVGINQNLIAAIAYASPEANFSPVSETTAATFGHIYPSPAYPPTQSGDGSPHSNASPVHSMQSSPRAIRSTIDNQSGMNNSAVLQMNPPSPVVQRFNRRMKETFQHPVSSAIDSYPTSVPQDAVSQSEPSQTSPKRKRGQDKGSDTVSGKRRTIKPRTAVTAIQSVLNPDNEGHRDQSPLDLLPPAAINRSPERRTTSPTKTRRKRPLSIEMPNTVSIPILQSGNTTPRVGSGYNTPRLLLPSNMSPGLSEPFQAVSTLSNEQNRQFGLQSANSLSMVLNSETGSSLASPQLFEFPQLDVTNTTNEMMASTPRGSNGRLPVQSLLSLPSVPTAAESSPSMQAMQISPPMMEQSHMQLPDPEIQRPQFNLRMTGDEQMAYTGGLSDGTSAPLQHTSSWAEILLQPSSTFPNDMAMANNEALLQSQLQRTDDPTVNASHISYAETQPENSVPIEPHPPPEDKFVQESVGPANQGDHGKNRRRRGKHSRYVATEGRDGEPDKTHIDVLVKVIQTAESSTEPSKTATDPKASVEENSFPLFQPRNSLPPIEALERSLLLAGITSANDHGQSNVSFNVLDFLPENIEWNDILVLPNNGQQGRFNQHNPQSWAQSSGHDISLSSSIVTHTQPPPTPSRVPSLSRFGRKSVEPSESIKGKGKEETSANQVRSKSKSHFECTHPGCTAKFLHQHLLKTHMESHKTIKPFKCDFAGCNQLFSQKGNLKAHQRKHTGEKPFVCEHCDRAFAQKGNLQTHRMIHLGSKPYVCLIDKCAARYSQRGNLKMHQNKFHTETIQRLTAKAEASSKGGPPLDEEEQKVADHLKILYKFANKGIKGRGKKETNERRKPQSKPPAPAKERPKERPSERIYEPPTLLPPPPAVAGRGLEGTTSAYLLPGTSGWSRPERMEDVFVGGQHTQQAQSSSFISGISGDGGGMGIGGYAFGNLG